MVGGVWGSGVEFGGLGLEGLSFGVGWVEFGGLGLQGLLGLEVGGVEFGRFWVVGFGIGKVEFWRFWVEFGGVAVGGV